MDINEPGWKYHMNDVNAAIGLTGLANSDKWLEYRKKIGEYYKKNLKCTVITGGTYWLAGILVNDRDRIAKELKDSGIETNMVHIRNDEFTIFKNFKNVCPNMDEIENTYLYIPINTYMTIDDAKYIVEVLNAVL